VSDEPQEKRAAGGGGYGPFGDKSLHLSTAELERRFGRLLPPREAGTLALIVSRGEMGIRATPSRALLTPEDGVPGDAWQSKQPVNRDAQITLMRVDVARLIANGQPLTLFGDNLLVDLDLSVANLPAGSRLRVGAAMLEVTPEPHNGCLKFHQRFGRDALRLTAHRRFRELRLRGIYAKVVEPGKVELGDPVEILSRA
jgi:MOSC domain-containing protein YiiM